MFNLLKVMELVLQENEGQPEVSWEGLISQIRDKIRYYIKLMVEGSNICLLYTSIGHRLITADIHSPHNNAAPGGRLQRLTEDVVKLIFRWRAGPVHIQHLCAEQANRLRAIVECRHRLYRMGDVRRDLDADTVFRLPWLIQPYLLLLLDLRLNPRLLLICLLYTSLCCATARCQTDDRVL